MQGFAKLFKCFLSAACSAALNFRMGFAAYKVLSLEHKTVEPQMLQEPEYLVGTFVFFPFKLSGNGYS